MTLTLQVPGEANTLRAALVATAMNSIGGFATFAFATATGIDTWLAEPAIRKVLASGKFQLVVGLDAITDTAAVAALKTAQTELPQANISLFYNQKGGVLYHPKTMFFKRASGGTCLTGSGNLTLGGLRNNWEAFWKADLSGADTTALEAQWAKWVADHKGNLLTVDDPRVIAQAALNAKTRARIQKAVKETDAEALAALEEEAAETASLNPFLIAEVPKNRPGQADVGINAYQGFFGATAGKERRVTFYRVLPNGALSPPEERKAFAVQSGNYRFEVEALSGLAHPANDHFILVFERIGKSEYRYVLLKPGEAGHGHVQKFLNDNYFVQGNSKRRVVVTKSDVQAAWPDNPLLLH
jgi:hypothetical protein